MSQAPNIDGVLIQWGDRLFYPGNRVVKTKPQPKLGTNAARQRGTARASAPSRGRKLRSSLGARHNYLL